MYYKEFRVEGNIITVEFLHSIYHLEVVETIPKEYQIWPIDTHPEYIALCEKVSRKDPGRKVNVATLKAIKLPAEEAAAI